MTEPDASAASAANANGARRHPPIREVLSWALQFVESGPFPRALADAECTAHLFVRLRSATEDAGSEPPSAGAARVPKPFGKGMALLAISDPTRERSWNTPSTMAISPMVHTEVGCSTLN